MNNDNLQAWIEPELEARIVAAVLGEASAFELAELERLAAEKPELGIFRRRIEAVHGLLGQALRPEQAPMRLAPERRARILEAIGAAATPEPDQYDTLRAELAEARRKRRANWYWRYGLAAVIPIAAVLAIVLLPSNERTKHKSYELADRAPAKSLLMEMPRIEPQEAAAEDSVFAAPTAVAGEPLEAPTIARSASVGVLPQRIETNLRMAEKEALAAEVKHRESKWNDAANLAAAEQTFNSAARHYYVPPVEGSAGMSAASRTAYRDLSGSARTTVSLAEPKLTGGVRRGFSPDWNAQHDSSTAQTPGTSRTWGAVMAPIGSAMAAQRFSRVPEPAAGLVSGAVASSANSLQLSAEGARSAQVAFDAYNSPKLAGTRVLTAPLGLIQQIQAPDSPTAKLAPRIAAVNSGGLADANSLPLADGFLAGVTGTNEASAPAAPVAQTTAAAEDKDLSDANSIAIGPPPAAPASATDTEISTTKEAISTFSLHVSDASFRVAQAALARGELPDPAQIRPEEFYNAFDYGDPAPAAGEKVSCRIEQAAHPFLPQRNLVRIAMKVGATGRTAGQPLHLTVLLDTSGSMEREDRIASVQRALAVLASLLGPDDRVTLIGFARQPRLLAENLAGDTAATLPQVAARTPFTGGTNMEEALKLAGELARRHADPTAQNRIVMITDGAANLGNANPAELATRIEQLRQQGIAFDACGVGTDGLDDAMLEALTRKGDGRYYVIDRPEDADANFARQLAGAFRPAAQNVKVQVRFNPARVAAYRLIGFEQHRLRTEDFRNDQVDAAELAAEEAAVALYQVEVLPQGEGELGDVFVRFRDTATGSMVERSWTMLHEPKVESFEHAPASLQLAGTAALLAEKLRGGEQAGLIDLGQLTPVVNALRGRYAGNARVQELVAMFEQARRASGR